MKKTMQKHNKLNFGMTLFSELLFVLLSVSVSFMMKALTEAVEYQSGKLLDLGTKLGIAYVIGFIIASKIRKYFFSRYIETSLIQLKDYIFDKVLSKSISDFERSDAATIISGLSNDMSVIENHYLFSRSELLYNFILVLFSAAALLYFNFRYGLIIVLTFLVLLILSLRGRSDLKQEEVKTSDSNKRFINQVSDILEGFVEIKSFGAEEKLLDIFKEQNRDLEGVKKSKRQKQQDINLHANMSSMILNIVAFVLGFYYAFRGDMSFGTVMGSVMLANILLGPIRNLGPLITNLSSSSALLDRLEASLAEEGPETKALSGQSALRVFEERIALQNVSYAYDDEPVIEDLSFDFQRNKKYAIVGLSGSGKTTLLKLLLAYLNDYEGEIFYDDLNLSEISLESLYDKISVLQQDVFLFDASLEDNITMFNSYDEKTLQRVIEQAGLSELVESKGLDYRVGERGENLSGGEKQRVSIARVLIRNCPIIYTDEATSSLDAKTAASVERSILAIPDTTLIAVTHRYTREILECYDCIIAMKDGRIEEQGTFDELMDAKGYFYSLFVLSS